MGDNHGMAGLQTLRSAHLLTRLVLVWFALFVGAAVASPWLKTQDTQMVCTAMGVIKTVVAEDAGDSPTLSGGMDCPLCAHVSAPLARPISGWQPFMAQAHALRPAAPVHRVWQTGSPLPPRGPPALS